MISQTQTNEINWNIANAMFTIYQTLKDSKLKIKETNLFLESMKQLMSIYQLSQNQIWILCIVCTKYLNSDCSYSLSNIADILGLNIIQILDWHKEIFTLEELGVLNRSDGNVWPSREFLSSLYNNHFFISKIARINDELDFLDFFAKLYESRLDKYKSSHEIQKELAKVENNYKHFEMITRVYSLVLEQNNRFFLYDISNDVINGNQSDLKKTLSYLYDENDLHSIEQKMINEENELFETGLIEFIKKDCISEAKVTLTDKGKKLVFDEKAVLVKNFKNKKNENVIEKDDIITKKLFYSETNQKEITRLKNSLQENNFRCIQRRLKDDGLPTGISVLLYGAPGTGKTESVKQIAKETDRSIIHVDISEARDSKYGASEKLVKRIFTNYKETCLLAKTKEENIPILLFNEADALLFKRQDPEVSCADVNNSILDIMLEELETLDGIFFATTNLALNLDEAFERRFLFKIKFEKPTMEAKTSIWQNKLPWLDKKSATDFAQSYDFSGGQIDNIVRKIALNEVINGERPAISEIHDMCKCEKIENPNGTKRVGFCF